MIFNIPVNTMTTEEAEKNIKELMKKYNSNYGFWTRKDRKEKYNKLFL